MKTLDRIVKDYDQNIVTRDKQMQVFEYLFEKKGDLYIVIFRHCVELPAKILSHKLYKNNCFETILATSAAI